MNVMMRFAAGDALYPSVYDQGVHCASAVSMGQKEVHYELTGHSKLNSHNLVVLILATHQPLEYTPASSAQLS